MVIALRDDLLVRPLSLVERRRWVLSALAPVVGALLAAPLAFVTSYGGFIAIATMLIVSFGLSALIRRRYPIAP